MKNIKISNKIIGLGKPVFIVAEAGVNHNGKFDLVLKLIDAAALAGADAIKFQTFKAEQVVTARADMAKYQKKNTGKAESQASMLKKLEFKEGWYAEAIRHSKKRGIIFFSTPHGGFASVDLLQGLGMPVFKFGSGDLTNLPLLAYAAKFQKPMILGTGMATMAEINEAVRTIEKQGNNKISLLHCTSNYPTEFKDVNLLAMKTMMKKFKYPIGYSDHTSDLIVPIAAVALGARVIEKHFTLDRNLPGPDHRASMTPRELANLVRSIRDVSTALGSSIKKPVKSEAESIRLGRKSIITEADIKKGSKISRDLLAIKRPSTGIHPRHFYKIIGSVARKDIPKDTLIKWDMIK